jgi:hypothetical protein
MYVNKAERLCVRLPQSTACGNREWANGEELRITRISWMTSESEAFELQIQNMAARVRAAAQGFL